MRWKRVLSVAAVMSGSLLFGQQAEQPVTSLDGIRFLEGTWEAKTPGGKDAPAVTGTYSFRRELGGHVLARHSSSDACKGPADFDCDHHDLLYVYQDAPGQALQAIYFDSEGHVLHYQVLAAGESKAEFVSSASIPGPRFRLVYELHDGMMSGKFQMQAPGQADWKSYLDWSGSKK